VVAEGVEDDATYKMLRTLDCDYAHGYFISPALPAEKLQEWLRTSPWGQPAQNLPHRVGART
jgi:EAL domain-containing protein (putative c-di-GMP-specific phosphodiesterase class I)